MTRALVLLSLLLVGCTHVAPQEPALPFPDTPSIHFFLRGGAACLSEEEANMINRWFKKLDAFQEARNGLLKAQ